MRSDLMKKGLEKYPHRSLLKAMGLKPVPQMVRNPRTNPYVFFWPEEIKKEVK